MRIAVCDDEKFMRKEIISNLGCFSIENGIDILIDEFACGEDLLFSKISYDLVFIDYQMTGLNGMETARKLKDKNIKAAMIFLTSFSEFVYDSFEVSAFRFLTKPIDKTKFNKALTDYIKTVDTFVGVIINAENKIMNINSGDILYIEGANKQSIVCTTEKSFICQNNMTDIENQLPRDCFFRTHRSYIVNFRHVKEFDEKIIKLFNGEVALLSRSNLVKFKMHYIKYMKRSAF